MESQRSTIGKKSKKDHIKVKSGHEGIYSGKEGTHENKIGETKTGFLFLPFLREGRSLVAYEEDGDDESFCACGCKLGAA